MKTNKPYWKSGKPCPVCGKTPKQSYHVACGIELDRRKKETLIGFSGITQDQAEKADRNRQAKKYRAGYVPGFALT
jgi:hypothetical protein